MLNPNSYLKIQACWAILSFILIFSSKINATGLGDLKDNLGRLDKYRRNLNGPTETCPIQLVANKTIKTEAKKEFSCSALKDRPKESLKTVSGEFYPVSVLNEEDISKLTRCYPSGSYLDVYDDEICAQRTQVLGHHLGRQGIETAKIFIRPKQYPWYLRWFMKNKIRADEKAKNKKGTPVEWDNYHVANVIYVQPKDDPDGPPKMYILDPFLEQEPQPYEKWKARLIADTIGSEQFGSRFHYKPVDLVVPMKDYEKDELKFSYDVMSGKPR